MTAPHRTSSPPGPPAGTVRLSLPPEIPGPSRPWPGFPVPGIPGPRVPVPGIPGIPGEPDPGRPSVDPLVAPPHSFTPNDAGLGFDHQRIARATGQPVDRVVEDFARNLVLDADDARRYGIVQEVRRARPAPVTPLRPPSS